MEEGKTYIVKNNTNQKLKQITILEETDKCYLIEFAMKNYKTKWILKDAFDRKHNPKYTLIEIYEKKRI